MSDELPDKCPFCGAPKSRQHHGVAFECDTYACKAFVYQSRECVENTRDQLSERIKQLERELNEAKRQAARYKVVRRMNPTDFRELHKRCGRDGLYFDDEVDRIGGIQ